MNPQNPRTTRWGLIAAAMATASLTIANAATLTWDHSKDGTASDGAGSWLGANQWLNVAVPSTWSNATPDDAIIGSGGAGGTLDLTGGVTAGTVTFEDFTGTYNLSNGVLTVNTGMTLGADSGILHFQSSSGFAGTGTVTIDGTYPVAKGGPTQLSFWQLNESSNNFTGTYDVRNGILFTQGGDRNGGSQTVDENSTIILNGKPGAANGAVFSSRWGGLMNRDLGTSAGEIQVSGNRSGFEGQGTNGMIVRLNNDPTTPIVWGSANFDPDVLILQSPNANTNGNVRFDNTLDLNGAPRTIDVDVDVTAGGYAELMQLIINSDAGKASGLTKTGPGVLRITKDGPTYDGPTIVNEGFLQLGTGWTNSQTIPGGISSTTGGTSNLEINNANVRLAYYMRRPLGTGPTDVQLTGGTAGFSHIQSDTLGNITFNNDANTEIVWGNPEFNPAELELNNAIQQPNQVVQINNKIDLNGADRTVVTNSTTAVDGGQIKSSQGFMTTTGGRLTNVIRNSSGTAAGLIKGGPGHLQLTAANTYDGGTTVNEGELEFTKIAAMPANGVVTVNDGTTLTVALGGGGEWTTGTSGHGTLGGLLAGKGGQAPSTVNFVGTTNLGLNVTGAQSYSGVISGAGNVLVKGSGSLDLTANNTFTGDIIVDGGATLTLSGDNSGATGKIRIINGFLEADVANLPGGGVTYDSPGNNPAVLKTSGSLTPTIGSSDDVYWNNNGGFAATNSALTVTPNAGAEIDWSGNNGFRGKKLQLGSSSSTASVELTNDIDLDGNRTIYRFNNSGSNDDIAILSGDISGGGSNRNLSIEGRGTTILSGANNFGTGILYIGNAGVDSVVRATDGVGLPAAANLRFNQGVLESSGSFTRSIGTGSGQVYWNGRGGFAANGGALTVDLGGAGASIAWNANPSGFRGQNPLYFGSATADNVVTFENGIGLDNNRNIQTTDNPDTDADYTVINGVISQLSGSRNLTIQGNGKLVLGGDNTYTGTTTINGGTLIINGDCSAATGLVDVRGSGRVLGGTGTIGGDVTLENNAGLTFDLTTAPASHDKLDVVGSFTFEGASVLTITSSGGTPELGTYTLVSAGSAPTGSVPATVNLPAGWTADAPQIDGNDLVINITAGPAAEGSPYETWATGGELFEHDENGDGVSNGMAFLMGAADPSADASGLIPTMANTVEGLQLSFTMLDSASRGGATLSLMHSTDLRTWTEVVIPDSDGVTDGVSFTVTGSGTLSVTATIAHSHAVEGKLFGRLEGTIPE